MDTSLLFPLLLLGLLACASCNTCPPAEDIAPCTCRRDFEGNIDIDCVGGSLKEIDGAFNILRGNTIRYVLISTVKGGRLSSLLFWNTRVKQITIFRCDLRGLSDSDRSPAFLGLEHSLEILHVFDSIKGDNQLQTLDMSHLKKLDDISLSRNNIPEVGNEWFAKGPLSLKVVSIDESGVSKIGDTAFAPLANLQILSLWGNRLMTLKRSMLPNPASHLNSLELQYNNFTSLSNDIFSGMPSLQSVLLQGNSIRRIEESTWSSIWEQLNYLDLMINPLECDSHMEWMFSLKTPKELYGTCDSPESVKEEELSDFIEINRKLLSLTEKSSGSSSKKDPLSG